MKKKEIKITLDNCEGYSKLYNKPNINVDVADKIQKNIVKATIVAIMILILSMTTGIFGTNLLVTTSLILGSFFTPLAVYMQNMYCIDKNYEKEIASMYPDVDLKVSQIELERSLKNAGILKCEYDKDGNVYEYYDIEGFKNCCMANQVKEDILEEYNYKNFSNDFNISRKEMDKVKVKVKNMVRK